MEFNVILCAKHVTGAVFAVIWGIMMLHLTLGKYRKREKKNYAVYPLALTAAVILTCIGSYAAQWMEHLMMTIPDELYYNIGYNLSRSFVWILADMFRVIVPLVILVIIAIIEYNNDWATKLFTAVMLVLVALVVNGYIAPVTAFPKYFGQEETADVGIAVYALIRLVWFTLFYIGYKKFLRERFLQILDMAEGQMGKFVTIPVISCIAFCVMISFFYVMGVTYLSPNFLNQVFWCVMIAILILVYIWMYSGIFKAVTLATESMKTKAELDVASKIQASVLPRTFPAFPEREEFDIYATMHPAKEVGGDFYDFFMIDETRLAIVIADVSGKGVPAALFMMSARTMIKNQSFLETDPAKVLGIVNNQLAENNEEGMFVTTFLGIYDLAAKEFTYSNGGHNPPYIVRADGAVEKLPVLPGFVLGGIEGIRYKNQSVRFANADKLLLYTDGVTEAVNPSLELYGEGRLEETLEHTEKLSPKPCIDKIMGSLKAFAEDAEQADDITMVVLKICD